MDYDFQTTPETLRIPPAAFRPVKRCPFCESVFIDDKFCESCGRSMQYHLIGEAFGPKSYYGIKERYIENMPSFTRLFSQFENKKSPNARSYVRKLSKRFADLVTAFNSPDLLMTEQRKLFYVESLELIDELLRYETDPHIIYSLLEQNDNSLIGQELIYYLQQSNQLVAADRPWKEDLSNYRLWGLIRSEFFVKALIVSATISVVAVKYKEIISSQFGK